MTFDQDTNELIVTGQHAKADVKGTPMVCSRPKGAFHKSIILPGRADASKAKLDLEVSL